MDTPKKLRLSNNASTPQKLKKATLKSSKAATPEKLKKAPQVDSDGESPDDEELRSQVLASMKGDESEPLKNVKKPASEQLMRVLESTLGINSEYCGPMNAEGGLSSSADEWDEIDIEATNKFKKKLAKAMKK